MTRRWTGLVVIVAMVVFSVVAYPSLPERVATHWNIAGEPDSWSSRAFAVWLGPAIALGVWLLLPVLRRIDPRRANYDRFDPTFWLVVNMITLFLGLVHALTLGAALGWRVDITRAMLMIVGALFVILGNYMPRLRSNWWMGIRTPWTLESESVWRATHRLAGWTFAAAGVLTVLSALLPSKAAFFVAMASMMCGAFIPVIYSYIAFRREQRTSTS